MVIEAKVGSRVYIVSRRSGGPNADQIFPKYQSIKKRDDAAQIVKDLDYSAKCNTSDAGKRVHVLYTLTPLKAELAAREGTENGTFTVDTGNWTPEQFTSHMAMARMVREAERIAGRRDLAISLG